MSADRNLLFGILALQHNLISDDQLVAALQGWLGQQSKTLAELLESNGAISPENRQSLEPLVAGRLAAHGADAQHSVSTIPSIGSQSTQSSGFIGSEVAATMSFAGSPAPAAPADRGAVGQSTSSGRFRILQFHAAGGLGQVSLARDSELNRDVALKEIKPQYAAHSLARNRFVLEAEITGGLEHPSIVPVYGLGAHDDGRPFYAMRFIKGDTLKQAIDRHHQKASGELPTKLPKELPTKLPTKSQRALELRKLLGRFIDVCQAVDFAHSRSVLHRDLKPDNVMLGSYGETLVVDWGLAKALPSSDAADAEPGQTRLAPAVGRSDNRTEMGDRVGTLRYMSPEQAAGQLDQLGPATDIFSLGATLYHLLTGRAMYTADNQDELLESVAAVRFPPPRSIRDDIPKPLEAICLRSLAASPADRYPSARALLEDIECYLADEPVTAYREPFVARARRWARKHPGLVSGSLATVAVTLLALALGNVVLSQKNLELSRANSSERTQRQRAERGEESARLNEQEALKQERIARQNEAKAREEEAIANAVKNFLLNDLLALTEPDLQADAQIKVDPDLKVQTLFRRAADRIDLQFPPDSPIAAELKPLVLRSVPPRLTVRELMLRASDKIAGRFERQPETEHDVRLAIGLALRAVGEYARSVTHLERCYELVRQLREPEDPAVFSSLSNLATGYHIAGRSSEALPLLEQTLRERRAHLGPHHPQTLRSLSNLANAHSEVGDLRKALPLLEETLEQRREHLGADHEDTFNSMENLANGYLRADRLSEAVPLYTQVLEHREAALGPEHPDTIRAVVNLAMAFRVIGELPTAVAMLERALKLMRTQLGPDHPATLTAMNSLANAYKDLGRLPQAVALFERTLELREKKLGPDHLLTLTSLRNLGVAYRHLRRPDKALPLFQRALEFRREKQGRRHPETLVEMSNVGDALSELGRGGESIPLYQEALQGLREAVGAEHAYTLLVTSNLAIEYRNADRLDDALPLLEQVLAFHQKKRGLQHPDTVRTLGSLAITEAKLKKWPAAERHFLAAWKAIGSFPPELREQFRRGLGPMIVAMYEAWDKPEEADAWRKRIAELR